MTDGIYTVGLYTLGCKVSQYETEAIGEAFEREGFLSVPFSEKADVYVVNTCTVTEESDRKSRQFIRRAIRKNPEAVVIVIGCYAQRAAEELIKINGVSAVIGTQDKLSAVKIAKDFLENPTREGVVSVGALDGAKFENMCITRASRTRVYVKIEDGCESKCTYCAISPARGPVRSKPREDVIKEVEGLAASGVAEIVLTGIETGSYGKDFDEKYTLADLVYELNARKSCKRIRLGSLAPELIGRDFVNRVSGCEILAPHFHISIQSGSDEVLRRMKRRYNTKQAYENIEALRDAFPTAMFTTDLMVGFPDESEENFLETCDFLRKVGFLDAHVFAYSRREGTPAAEYENQVPEDVKRQRSERLIAIKNEVRDRVLDTVVREGKALSCVLEVEKNGIYTGHSDSFIEVSVSAQAGLKGCVVDVMPLSHKDGMILGEIAKI